MRIALFVHCFFPVHFYGTETYTFELAKNLKELGHDPVVVTAVFPGEPRQPEPVLRYEFEGIPVWSIDKNLIPATRVKDTYYQPEMVPVLIDIVRALRPDIAHVTHLINHTGVLLEVLDSESIPTVATFTDFFGFCYNNRLEAVDGSLCDGPNATRTNCLACHLKASNSARPQSAARRLIDSDTGAVLAAQVLDLAQRIPGFRAGPTAGLVQDIAMRPDILGGLYRRYREVIAPTRFLRRAYVQNGLGANMTEIRFGVDIARDPKPPRAAGKPLTIGFIGQIAAHKGPDLLVEAAEAALGQSGYEIRSYGSLDQDAQFSAQLQSRSAGLPVQFLGTFPKEKMRQVLDELDVLVIPSRWYENSPLVLLNALASHTPVVVSDVEGMTEFVEDGVNGFVFTRSSAASLAEVLRKIGASRKDLPDLWRNAHYEMTTRTMTEKTLQVYEGALAPPSHRASAA